MAKKYGAEIARKIVTGKYDIGTPKDICQEALAYYSGWGDFRAPIEILSKTATSETWKVATLWETKYLFFIDNKLVRISY